MKNNRVTFASKLGMVLAAAGSAVGLGNIWRFPSQTADGGGAIFILIYLACILFFGLPLMISEFLIGRASQANASDSFTKLAPGTPWKWVGRVGILSATLILGYYLVVCGWTVIYFIESVTGALGEVTDFSGHFSELQGNGGKQSLYVILFAVVTATFTIMGVKTGIEKASKILMPLLFLLLIALAVRAISLPGSTGGLHFLLYPDFLNVEGKVFLAALGQTFFSLSLGMSVMITYGSYFRKDSNLPKSALQISILDTLVALLAGFIIFPAAFALTPDVNAVQSELVAGGPGLLFITLPGLFKSMPLPMLWSALFFLLLIIAALTSTISLLETGLVFISERFGISRTLSSILVAVFVIVIGVLSSYWPQFFNLLDFTTAKVLLPLTGLPISIFVGWYLDRKLVYAELSNNGTLTFGHRFLSAYTFILRYVAPLGIMIIFVYGLVA